MTSAEVVVIGGGPAGSSAALWLAGAGVRVTLVERSDGPHDKVCGEFVGPGAQAYLRRLGVAVEGPEIRTLRLSCAGRTVVSALPFVARAWSRRALDERLLAAAAAQGAEIRRGVAVRDLDPATLRVGLASGDSLSPRAVFLATGKHDLRGHTRDAAIRADHVGLKIVLGGAPEPGAIDLLVFPGGYAGYLPLGGGRATLCVAITAERYRGLGRSWPRLMAFLAQAAPAWRDLLAGAEPLWPQPLAVAKQPYGFVARPEVAPIFRIGDQAAVVPSFAGEGIGLALASAHLAAQAYLEGAGAAVHGRRMAETYRRVARLGTLSRLGETAIAQAVAMRVLGVAPRLLGAAARATRLAR